MLRTIAIYCRLSVFALLLNISLQHEGRVFAEEPERPNILFILADDLAWSDLGCYGHPWHDTPRMDSLAASGMRFTNGYAPAPICSASRASLLTGKTTARLRFEFVTKNEPGRQQIDAETPLVAPRYTLNLHLSQKTVSEYLSELGYQTAFFGKWHLNAHHQRYLGWSPVYGPPQQGFSVAVEDFGTHPYGWQEKPPALINTAGRFHSDSMVGGVCEFLEQSSEQPFFLVASSFYVHTPVKTTCQWLVDKYEKLVPEDAPNRSKRIQYAAFLETLDHHVGQILDALERSGKLNTTLIVLTSDNGGHPEFTANAPLRGSKWNLYEGGIRVPFIASWAGQIEPGSECDSPVIGYDLLPTFVDVAGGMWQQVDGISLAEHFAGTASAAPSAGERQLLWHFPYYHPEKGFADAKPQIGINDFAISQTRPQSALRVGRYKLIQFAEDDRMELYDLEADPGEQNDLSQQREELRESMRRQLVELLTEMNARHARKASSELIR